MVVQKHKDEECYLCGSKENLTRDHVVPVCLFASPKPKNLLTLPCCRSCNAEYSDDEEYFRDNVSLLNTPNYEEVVQPIYQKTRRGLLKKPGKYKEIRTRMGQADFVTPGGVFLGKVDTITFNQEQIDRINRIFIKIARGLFYFHSGQRTDQTWRYDCHFYPKSKLVDELKKVQHRGAWGKTFEYAGIIPDIPQASFWHMTIYQTHLARVMLDAEPIGDISTNQRWAKLNLILPPGIRI